MTLITKTNINMPECSSEYFYYNTANAVVATMILLKLAVMRYNNKKAVAWQEPRPSILTRKGQEKHDECFRNIHLQNYQYEVQETND